MDWINGEPTIDDLMSDEIIKLVLQRDRLDLAHTTAYLREMAGRLRWSAPSLVA